MSSLIHFCLQQTFLYENIRFIWFFSEFHFKLEFYINWLLKPGFNIFTIKSFALENKEEKKLRSTLEWFMRLSSLAIWCSLTVNFPIDYIQLHRLFHTKTNQGQKQRLIGTADKKCLRVHWNSLNNQSIYISNM